MSDDVLVKVEGVSKKFCRSLKRSLWYGVQDVTSEMLGRKGQHDELRKNEFWAVNDVSFELKRGECLGLIGPNGAGKSTLLKMLNGLVKPDKGRITMRGRVGALIELGAGFNPILTARENIYINGSVLGFSKKEIDQKFDAIVEFSEIEAFINTPVQSFSSGMKVRLGFAVAAQLEPDVLLVDEVLAVGDVQFRMKCFQRVLQLGAEGTSIALVSHSTLDINRTCDRALVMAKGRVDSDTDVSRGVAAYLRLCGESDPGQRSNGPGSVAQLQAISINKVFGGNEIELRTGDRLVLEITIDCIEAKDHLRVWVGIFSSAFGMISSFSTTETGSEVKLKHGLNSLTLEIPSLPLGIGHYSISCGLYGEEVSSVYDYKDSIATFSVVGPRPKRFGYGSDGALRIAHFWGRERKRELPPTK